MTPTQKQAEKDIEAKTAAAMKLIREAQKIADKHTVEFSFSVAYGMGGWYYPKGHEFRDDEYDDDDGWSSSSASC